MPICTECFKPCDERRIHPDGGWEPELCVSCWADQVVMYIIELKDRIAHFERALDEAGFGSQAPGGE